MKLMNFRDHLKKRLDKDEINELEKQAQIEYEALKLLQHDVAAIIAEHMEEKGISFNELIRNLGISPTQGAKIKKGEANLTFASLAHIAGYLGKRPHIVFS
jgi:ribosome-binding protein aMBF1 (putative translation factor)